MVRITERLLPCALGALLLAGVLAPRADAAIYWSNQDTETIGRANNNGSALDNSFVDVSGATQGACAVAVGPGYVYWTGGSGTGYVGRASLGTGDPEDTFITTGNDQPCGVAVDSAHVYFNNYAMGAIGRADLDGNNVIHDFIEGGVNPQHPSVDGDHIFWSNKGFDCSDPPPSGCTIGRADLDGTPVNQDFITGTDEPPSGTATGGTYVYWGNGFNSIGRRKADGSALAEPNFIPSVDACAVAVDGSHIYWADYAGAIGRANIDGTGVNENYIQTAGGTCGVAVDGLTIAPPPPKPKPTPLPPTDCTSATTLLVTCANLAGAPGVCGPGLELFPQCLLPVVPRTVCNPNQVCSPTTPGERPATGSCASMGQALPECNVPRREVPTQCAAYGFSLDPLPGQMCWTGAPVAITNCPPPSPAVTPACSFSTNVTTPNPPRASAARVRRRLGRRLTVTIGCPKELADPATKRCTGTIAVDGLRKSLLRTLAKQAEYSAGSYRYFMPGQAAFAGPFQKSANKIAKRVFRGTKLPKAVKTAKVVAELGRSDAQTLSYAASLQRAVKEYRKLAGKTRKRRRSKKSDARASRSTTTLKRFKLKSGRRRARIKIRLSRAAVRRLRKDAGNRTQVPIRVIVSYKATPRPVVRFVDLAVLVR